MLIQRIASLSSSWRILLLLLFILLTTAVCYVLADEYEANQQRGQLRIVMLAGDFWEKLVLWLLHSTTGLSNKSAKC